MDKSKHHSSYTKGQTIFCEGSYPRGLFCVNDGKIKITQTGVDGKEQIVHLARNADVLGYRALLSGDAYSCSAIAMEDSTICFIPKDAFLFLVEKNSRLGLQLINLLSKELRNTENKLTQIAQRPARERVAQTILLLKECYGFASDGITLNIMISREEIASMSGTTRETAIRVLVKLNAEKVIALKGKKIQIRDPAELVKTANLTDC
ncbi:MAG: Crp/Fnr family transcriptional regulator [Bacteroidia bacterium]